MNKNIIQRYNAYNPKNKNCPLCTIFNSIFTYDSFENEKKIPIDVGRGYYKRILVSSSMEISISDITVDDSITMGEKQRSPVYCLSFCLGDSFQWKAEGNKNLFEIDNGECYIFNGFETNSMCSFNPGQRFWGVSIQLDSKTISNIVHHIDKGQYLSRHKAGGSFLYKRKISPAIKLIINDIINCRFEDTVKKIYLEGKILEMIAVYMDELMSGKEKKCFSTKISLSDLESLHEAKKILDNSLVAPPTIRELAKMVYINEYKLKKGFKELFGIPVHSYVIDKRMELARMLMEEKNVSVTDAVLHVGYSDASHFAEKFRKKYGVNPSEYINCI